MPYIEKEFRETIDSGRIASSSRELAYKLVTVLNNYIKENFNNKPRADDFLAIIGTLEGVKLETWRRLFVPYEKEKCELNGDVYPKEG